MTRFIMTRVARAVLTIAMVVTFAFVVLRASGDPARAMLSPETSADAVEAFRKAWGLDAPLWVQYVKYLLAVVHGDLGQSMRDGRTAATVVAERIPVTLMLTAPALALNLLLGIPAGIYAALKRDSFTDRLVMMVTVAGFTVPSFVLGLVLVLAFAVELPGFLQGRRQRAPYGPAGGHAWPWRRGRSGSFHPQRHARGARASLYPHGECQGCAMAQSRDGSCPAQCRHTSVDHRGFDGRQLNRGDGARRKRLFLAGNRQSARRLRRKSRSGCGPMHLAAGGSRHDRDEPRSRSPLRYVRSASARYALCWRSVDGGNVCRTDVVCSR